MFKTDVTFATHDMSIIFLGLFHLDATCKYMQKSGIKVHDTFLCINLIKKLRKFSKYISYVIIEFHQDFCHATFEIKGQSVSSLTIELYVNN